MISIRIDKAQRTRLEKFLRDYPERLKAAEVHLVCSMAETLRDRIRDLVRNVPGMESYVQGLQVVQVEGVPAAFAVRVKPTSRRIDRVDPKKTVLYVMPRRNRLKPTPDEILLLRRYNPWTLETLPFQPNDDDARIISRTVRDEEADHIAKMRLRQMPQIRQELTKVGKRATKLDQRRVKVQPGTNVVPDIAFEALRMEFGIGGGKGRPHWRPSLAYLSSQMGALCKRPQIVDTLRDPGFAGWTRKPSAASGSISGAEASTFGAFEKKIL